MEINEFSLGLFVWQSIMFLLLILLIYFVYKIYKKLKLKVKPQKVSAVLTLLNKL